MYYLYFNLNVRLLYCLVMYYSVASEALISVFLQLL